MQFRKLAIAAAICFTAHTVVARADDKSDITALYKKLEKAIVAKDIKGVMATSTKDFSYTENGKTITGEAMSAQMQQQFTMMSGTPKAKFSIISIDVKGKSATVVSTDVTEMSMALQDGKAHKIVASGKSKDLLVKTKDGWLMKTVTVLSNKMTLDGKAFDPTKPQGK